MNIRLLNIVTALTLVGMAACTGAKNSGSSSEETATKIAIPNDSLDEALDRLDPGFVVSSNGPDRYYLGMVTGAGGSPEGEQMSTLRSIDSVTFQVFAPDGRLIGSETTNRLTSSGVMNGETGSASITKSTGVEWVPSEPVLPGSYGVMIVHSRHGMIARRRLLANEEVPAKKVDKPLVMSLESRDMGSGVEFILHVERIAPAPEGEYLTSGELYRIELEDDVGETLWSSSKGKMFIQSIGQVAPTDVGQTVDHREYWDGQDDRIRGRLAPGTYRIIATIPAKPKPYILREEFTWSGQ